VYIVGSFDGSSLHFINGFSPGITLNSLSGGYMNMFLVKYDNSGQLIWAKNAGSNANAVYGNAISIDTGSGNIYVTGKFDAYAPLIFANDTLSCNCTGGNSAMFVAKYDSLGNALWGRTGTVSNSLGYTEGNDVSVDIKGNLYVIGSFKGSNINFGGQILTTAGDQEVFVLKYSPSGNVIRAIKATGSLLDGGDRITSDDDGNIYVGGWSNSGVLSFGTVNLNMAANQPNVFLAKYDSSGLAQWAFSPGGGSMSRWTCLDTDPWGNLYASGDQDATLNFINFALPPTTSSQTNGFLVKISGSGNPLWGESTGGSMWASEMLKISVDNHANIYSTGYFDGDSMTFNNITLYNNHPGMNNSNVFVIKQDSLANTLWAINAEGNYADIGSAIAEYNGDVFVSGDMQSNYINLGNIQVLKGQGAQSVFIGKMDPSVGISQIEIENRPVIFPNPASQQVYINSEKPIEQISICDQTGKLVLSTRKPAGLLDISSLDPGLYIVDVGGAHFKLVKE
jgi:hypothetical protein